jgi:hypothetical protein
MRRPVVARAIQRLAQARQAFLTKQAFKPMALPSILQEIS